MLWHGGCIERYGYSEGRGERKVGFYCVFEGVETGSRMSFD